MLKQLEHAVMVGISTEQNTTNLVPFTQFKGNSLFLAETVEAKAALWSNGPAQILASAQEFTKADDRMRHDVNLLHLYLDWGKMEEAKKCLNVMSDEDSSFGRFLKSPSAKTAGYMQFGLNAMLKFHLYRKINYREMLAAYPLEHLLEWFDSAANEHPFEFICAYLGHMAFQEGNFNIAREYFKHAISIPAASDHKDQPTLQVIRGEILTWWALEKVEHNPQEARKKIKRVVAMLEDIGATNGLEPMLFLKTEKAPSGWFAPGWKALSSIDWENEFNKEACEQFLKCFTFNYH